MSTGHDETNHGDAAIAPVRFDATSLALPLGLAVVALALPLMLVMVVLAFVIPGVPWWLGLIVGLLVAVVYVLSRLSSAHRTVLDALLGDATATRTSPRLENILNGMALVGGVSHPEVYVLPDDALNALAIRRGDELTIAVTRGLINDLELVELEGVVAELIARLRNGDAESATVYSAVFELTPGWVRGLFTPVAGAARSRLLDEGRDLQADRHAVSLTRYPPGLRRALTTIKADAAVPASSVPSLRTLWLVDPDHGTASSGSTLRVAGQRAPLELRIDVLAEL